MELHYTSRTIKEIEDVARVPIYEAISDFSMKTVLLLVRKGLDVPEEQAYSAIDKWLAQEDQDIFTLYVYCLKEIKKAGLLPKQIKIEKLEQGMEKMESQEIALPTTE
jgi:hypothetical protein